MEALAKASQPMINIDVNTLGILAPQPSVKKKRNRDTLTPMAHDLRYAKHTLMDPTALKKALLITPEKELSKIRKAHVASTANAEQVAIWRIPLVQIMHVAIPTARYDEYHDDRRQAIRFLYNAVFGAPAEEEWHSRKLVPNICIYLGIPQNSHSKVKKILLDIASGNFVAGIGRKSGAGRKRIIDQGSAQASIIYNCLRGSLTVRDTTCVLNMYRENNHMPIVSRSCIQTFIETSDCIKTRKRAQKKSGRDDPSCAWAVARLQQCLQWKHQIYLGRLADDNPEKTSSPIPPIYFDGVAFWDEHHRQIILGDANVYQHKVSVDVCGKVVSPDKGGVFGPSRDITSVKYPGEGRACCGVAVTTSPDGVSEGVRAKLFNYTGCKVVSDAAFQIAIQEEMRRVLPLKGVWRGPTFGYKERYGEDHYLDEVRKVVRKTLVSVHELIDHVISESRELFKGKNHQDTFLIFHDGLVMWWTPEAQTYIESLGFKDRQLRCLGDTNKGTRYHFKVVGDSPELCRGLDSTLPPHIF
jgi:hypothetical protein